MRPSKVKIRVINDEEMVTLGPLSVLKRKIRKIKELVVQPIKISVLIKKRKLKWRNIHVLSPVGLDISHNSPIQFTIPSSQNIITQALMTLIPYLLPI